MNDTGRRMLHWTPRVLGIAFAAFLAIFAVDVFDMPLDAGQRIQALLMHLVPAGLVLAALVLAWRHEWIGAILFPSLALLHLALSWGRLDWSACAAIEGPLILLGLLFGLDWRNGRTLAPGNPR